MIEIRSIDPVCSPRNFADDYTVEEAILVYAKWCIYEVINDYIDSLDVVAKKDGVETLYLVEANWSINPEVREMGPLVKERP